VQLGVSRRPLHVLSADHRLQTCAGFFSFLVVTKTPPAVYLVGHSLPNFMTITDEVADCVNLQRGTSVDCS